ncbi:MAG: hypothetical protein CR217_08050 [Beijerinckiaceae bacterium]|nr:MAG: hypothetical protein CR217_08050 [Beijerinckiaceae bacterium]
MDTEGRRAWAAEQDGNALEAFHEAIGLPDFVRAEAICSSSMHGSKSCMPPASRPIAMHGVGAIGPLTERVKEIEDISARTRNGELVEFTTFLGSLRPPLVDFSSAAHFCVAWRIVVE